MAARVASSATRVFHVEQPRPGAPEHPESSPAISVGHSRALRDSIPRPPRGTVIPGRQVLRPRSCSIPRDSGWFVPAATPTSNSIALGLRGKRSPLSTARWLMRDDPLRPPQHSMRRAARPDQRTRRRRLSGASLEPTGRATRAVRSAIGRRNTPPEDPHGSGIAGDRFAVPAPVGITLGPDGILWRQRAGGNRTAAPMALAISMFATGDIWHAASTRASAKGRDVPAQTSFPIPGRRSDVPELPGRLPRRAVTKT
jgi:hypothetical protein